MILLHRRAFGTAEYYAEVAPEQAGESLAQGLVVDVELTFAEWLGATPLRAQAFLDPGADNSILSFRWIRDQQRATGSGHHSQPKIAPGGHLMEKVEVRLEGHNLSLGDPERPVWVGRQGEDATPLPSMPGYEDLVLGRDFITQHRLLLLIDGEGQTLSLLAPQDRSNQERRDLILKAWES